jgi:predicted AAA+ superfamily ATPase
MRYIPRQIESELLSASKHFPGLILTGPRRAGKTTLLRKLFLLEAKASRTVLPEMAESLSRLSKAVPNYDVKSFLIYRPSKRKEPISALRPDTKAFSIEKLLSVLS